MDKQTIPPPPHVSRGLWRVLREQLALRIASTAAMVEADHSLSVYRCESLLDRQDLVVDLERTLNIQLDASALEEITTVGELAQLIAAQKRRTSSTRVYIVVYQNTEGRVIEEHVRAENHEAAIEALRASGLDNVLSVSRADDEDQDFDGRHGKLKICLILLALGLLAGAAYYLFFMRRIG